MFDLLMYDDDTTLYCRIIQNISLNEINLELGNQLFESQHILIDVFFLLFNILTRLLILNKLINVTKVVI